jgi:phage tail-like protein
MAADNGHLIVELEGQPDQTTPLITGVLTIGREPSNGLMLLDARVSRRHAELRIAAGGPFLTDLGSVNGTFLLGMRLSPHQPVPIPDGAVVTIGPFRLTYQSFVSKSGNPHVDASVEANMSVEASGSDMGAELVPSVSADAGAALPGGPSAPADAAGTSTVRPITATPRPTSLPMLPSTPSSRYLRDLPMIFHDNDFLGRFLLIFEALWEPLEHRQDHVGTYFDPHTCPASFLPWLAKWVDIAFNKHWPEARCRRLLSEAMDLYRWRGTTYGLMRMIEVCTGLTPEISDARQDTGDLQPFVFRVRLVIPPNSGVDQELIEQLVRNHKPAHMGYVLELAS